MITILTVGSRRSFLATRLRNAQMAAEQDVSRVERVLSDGLSMLRQDVPESLRPNVQPRGYDDRQLRSLSTKAEGAAAIAAAVRRSAERARTCRVCGAEGRAATPDVAGGELRQSVQWLIQRHSRLADGSESEDDDGEQTTTPLLLAPRWRLDLAERALVLDAAPFACPCCVVAMHPELLFELADAANASGGTGTPAATALDEVVSGYERSRAAAANGQQPRLTLQDAASLAHTLQLMAGGLPPLSVQLDSDNGAVQLSERNAPKLIARLLAGGASEGTDASSSQPKPKKSSKKRRKSDTGAQKPPASPQQTPGAAEGAEAVQQVGGATKGKKKKRKGTAAVAAEEEKVGRSTRSAPGNLLGTLSSEQTQQVPKKKKKKGMSKK
jgi:hypothetical protein